MKDWVIRCLTSMLFIFSAPYLSAASQPSSNPKPATKINKVVVDVVVTDDAGRPVKGLREQDFNLFENRQQQKILLFKAHDHASESSVTEPLNLPVNTFTNANASRRAAVNVVLLDQLNTSLDDQELARQELIKFLNQKPANAAFAIFSLRNDDLACQPNNSQPNIVQVNNLPLNTFPPSTIPQWTMGMANTTVPQNTGCGSRGMLLLVNGITQNKDQLIASLDSDPARPINTSLRPVVGMYGPSFNGYSTGPGEVYDTSMSWLAEIGNFLQSLPGRKNLIWMSDNFDAAPVAQVFEIWFPPKFKGWEKTDPFSPVQMTHLAASRLSSDRVAIYPVDLNGKNKDVEIKRSCPIYEPDSINSDDTVDSVCNEHLLNLNTMATESGGRAFHGQSAIQQAFKSAVSDVSNYYALTYSPTKAKFDGKTRSIKVSVNNKNYHLAYRKYYYADDPATLNRSAFASSPDLYLPSHNGGQVPWNVVRVIDSNAAQSDAAQEPITTGLRYGAPEAHDIVFTTHVDATSEPYEASAEQMAELQDYSSFRTDRMDNAMRNLTPEEKKTQHKGRTVVAALPPLNTVFLQPYSIDYSFSPAQLNLKAGADGSVPIKFEIAVLAYDAQGARVTGAKSSVTGSISSSELARFQASDYHIQQKVDIPQRATLLRLAVRNLADNRIGSIEIPVWAISSHYKRKRLKLPDELPFNNNRAQKDSPDIP